LTNFFLYNLVIDVIEEIFSVYFQAR